MQSADLECPWRADAARRLGLLLRTSRLNPISRQSYALKKMFAQIPVVPVDLNQAAIDRGVAVALAAQ